MNIVDKGIQQTVGYKFSMFQSKKKYDSKLEKSLSWFEASY